MNVECIWDLEEDPDGNVQHLAEHGVAVFEAEEVIRDQYQAAIAGRPAERAAHCFWLDVHGQLPCCGFRRRGREAAAGLCGHRLRSASARGTKASEEEAMNDQQRKTVKWTPEQRAQHEAIRSAFRTWHPGPEELIASGEAARLGLDVIHFPAQELLKELRAWREAAALTLAEVSARCGIDQPALSRLENGRTPNPTLDTLWRYAAALGKRLVLSAKDIKETPRRNGAKRTRKKQRA